MHSRFVDKLIDRLSILYIEKTPKELEAELAQLFGTNLTERNKFVAQLNEEITSRYGHRSKGPTAPTR